MILTPYQQDCQNRGKLGYTFSPYSLSASQVLTFGTQWFMVVQAAFSGLVNRLWLPLSANGATITAGTCRVGLYDTGQTTPGTATVLGSVTTNAAGTDLATAWAAGAGAFSESASLGGLQVNALQYYMISFVAGAGTTAPGFYKNQSTWVGNDGLSSATPEGGGYTITGNATGTMANQLLSGLGQANYNTFYSSMSV